MPTCQVPPSLLISLVVSLLSHHLSYPSRRIPLFSSLVVSLAVSLVLDLDETLVHASLEYMEDSHLNFTVTFHSQDYQVQ